MGNAKWIAYGLTGALGLGALAGGAALTASAMELRTDNGTVLQRGPIGTGQTTGADVGTGGVAVPTGTPSANPASASPVEPSIAPSAPATPTPAVPQPPASAPTTASAPTAVSPASPVSVASAASND